MLNPEPTPSIPLSALTGAHADLRLAQLGLDADELRSSIGVGYSHAAGCTDHDPRSLPGTLAWGKGTGHLRDLKRPQGWSADRTANLETVVHPSGEHAIALSAGTADTGRAKGLPRTKTPKGPATSRVVARNRQLLLTAENPEAFAGTGVDVEDPDPITERETWMLLHFYDKETGEIRLELSCPLEMKGKQITAWRERLILDPVPFTGEIEITIDEDDDPIDIDVVRRAD
jgi:hypothetical protein